MWETYLVRAPLAIVVPLAIWSAALIATDGGNGSIDAMNVLWYGLALLGAALLPGGTWLRWSARVAYAIVLYWALWYYALTFVGYFYGTGR